MPHLVTPRLTLRPFAPADWDAVRAMLADPLTTRFMHFAALTDAEGREWFDESVASAQQPDADPFFWAMATTDTAEVIGWLGIGTSTESDTPGERSFGYLVNHRYWNRGYMTEALRAVLADEFGSRGTPVLRATCNVANPASARVMAKAGMRYEQTVLDAAAEGTHHYVLTRAEYEAQS